MKQIKNFTDWFFKAIHTESFTDVHIDELGTEWINRSTWIEGGIHFLIQACEQRATLSPNVGTALSFMLKEGVDSELHSLSDLEVQMNYMPPSIYVTQPGFELWRATDTIKGHLRVYSLDDNLVRETGTPCSGLKTVYQDRAGLESVTSVWFVCD